MTQQFFRLIRLIFISLDLLVLNISFLIGKYMLSSKMLPELEIQYVYLLLFVNFSWITAVWFFGIYKQDNIFSFEQFCRRTLRAYLYSMTLIVLYIFLSKQQSISRSIILVFFISTGVGIMINRLIYLYISYFFRSRDNLTRKIIILGYNDTAKRVVQKLEEDPINTKIIGYCENQEMVQELSNYPILSDLNSVMDISKKYNATEIFSTILPDQNENIYQLIQKAEQACIRFKLVPHFSFFNNIPMHIDYFGNIPVLSLRKEPLEDVVNRIRKRLYDLFVSSLVVILILSWMIPLFSLLIWLSSKGPIFFIQKRSGKDNKPFGCLKFRSMKVNKDSHSAQASKNDPRITKLGNFLRKTSLDEFPQFLNVFIGQMSVVGPRPHMLKHTSDYSSLINKYMVRQFMKPGITGWAQINGFRGETRSLLDMEKRVEHDIWYMENWSLWLDTRIIFLTIYKIFSGDKNAF